MKSAFLPPLFFLFLVLLTPCLHAGGDAGVSYTGGKNYQGFGLNGSMDLDPNGVWAMDSNFAHVKSTGDLVSESNELSLGVEYTPNTEWNFHGALTGWKDKINLIHYAGPSFSATFNWLNSDEEVSAVKQNSTDQTPEKDVPPNSLLSVSFSVDDFVYGTEIQTSSRTVTTVRHGRRIPMVVPPRSRNETINQFHPSLEIDKPLFEGHATPFLSGGVYRYSKDPEKIEAMAGRPLFSGVAGRLNSLIGGFSKKEWEIGTSLTVPAHIDLHGGYGKVQSATDLTWSTVEEVSASRTFFDQIDLDATWNRAVQNDIPLELWTGEVTYNF